VNRAGRTTAFLLALLPAAASAWTDHASLLWPVVRAMPAMNERSVVVETLEDFLAVEEVGLARLLRDEEQRSRERYAHYAPRPEVLTFTAGAPDARRAFLEAIRVNPSLAYAPYRQRMIDDEDDAGARVLGWSDLTFLAGDDAHESLAYLPLAAGDRVTPAQVLATASDEPDLGIDIGLFEDNGTAHGARYGFGAQPFGNPNLDYGSQAPFHMGFYHLDWLTRTAQPGLLRTYPAWRVDLFGALARYAFATGHDYWGWRFAGWALHYIGDLAQPYHAQPLPGVSTARALWWVASGRSGDAVQLVSNRHGVIESYQFERLRTVLAAGHAGAPLLAALGDSAAPAWHDSTLIDGLARESVAAGAALDAALVVAVPARYVSDPTFEWTGSGEEPHIVNAVRNGGGEEAVAALDASLARQLRRFGRYARAWVNQLLAWRAGQG
jgi:hypothetical protein